MPRSQTLSKVPAVTLGFWILKILATTLGEAGGDAVSMSLDLGYAISTAIFAAILVAAVAAQIRAARFHPFLYWFVIVATTTTGTTLADFCDRSLGIGYQGGVMLLAALLLGTLALWHRSSGRIAVDHITEPKAEAFYWATIMFSQTLGTALGDFAADTELGYLGGAAVFGTALVLVALLYWRTQISRALLFWAAFILTRPLGATLADFLDKSHEEGGLELSRFTATAALAVAIVLLLLVLPQRAGEHPGKAAA